VQHLEERKEDIYKQVQKMYEYIETNIYIKCFINCLLSTNVQPTKKVSHKVSQVHFTKYNTIFKSNSFTGTVNWQ